MSRAKKATISRLLEEALIDGAMKEPPTAEAILRFADWLPGHEAVVGELVIPVLQEWLRRRAKALGKCSR